jgi:hypothetical protein
MDDKLPDQLDRLPTELKCTAARYITAMNDRKALALVNKAWSEVTLPILWENPEDGPSSYWAEAYTGPRPPSV